ncbi:OLC1v1012129C1 [Oldenlandia corymbosa var. corymbosa]|uniref:OLC1v1012129C1 n=1 Tax=Oldenlandia corymbosa var. corymbosa TaxID=529605 RepID=A0AAV1DVD4_OLDCO|nr:OLC1v1012129C1 [Oldenlandia corymbosa var. corymbosa]
MRSADWHGARSSPTLIPSTKFGSNLTEEDQEIKENLRTPKRQLNFVQRVGLTSNQFQVGEVVVRLVDFLLEGSADPLKDYVKEDLIIIISFLMDPEVKRISDAGDGLCRLISAINWCLPIDGLNFIFPRTNGMGFVNLFKERLKDLIEYQLDNIAFAKHQVVRVHDEFVSLEPYLKGVMELQKERDEVDLKDLWRRIMNLVFLADHVTGVRARQNDAGLTDYELADKLRRCLKQQRLHRLRQLSDDESWKILKVKLSQIHNLPLDDERSEIGEQIAKNCKGLPLSVVLVAGIRNSKNLLAAEEVEADFRYLTQLESLNLSRTGYGSDCLPSFPTSLRKLTLKDLKLPWSVISITGKLPNLEVLKLRRNAFSGRRWEVEDREFKKLKCLEIFKLDIEERAVQEEPFPSLERLRVEDCNELGEIPSGLGYIPTLKKIEMHWSSSKAATSANKILQEQQEMGNEVLEVVFRNSLDKMILWLILFGPFQTSTIGTGSSSFMFQYTFSKFQLSFVEKTKVALCLSRE